MSVVFIVVVFHLLKIWQRKKSLRSSLSSWASSHTTSSKRQINISQSLAGRSPPNNRTLLQLHYSSPHSFNPTCRRNPTIFRKKMKKKKPFSATASSKYPGLCWLVTMLNRTGPFRFPNQKWYVLFPLSFTIAGCNPPLNIAAFQSSANLPWGIR